MNEENERIIKKAVRLTVNPENHDEDKYSILPCLENAYLHPDYDPFQMLEFQLLANKVRIGHFGPDELEDDS